ncbi:hypothetical protein QRX50_16780 [Amycolatopsis carbonis]|uniref:DUF3558 domain-containing protein n=1 Tax=Amycolatopsis carbonis TaxID=715471 RepID=A0A9Y2IMX3_9PSEU|nr:hypothetical protein [Amycolatopsis sp. 2-15]WIX82294.1 hypothetical protein QRX50_16780 [Amycolatopsis sp. 2-15]
MAHDLKLGRLFPLVVAGVLVLTACGGPQLGKENFPRTTVPAASGDGGSGPITDAAVTTGALRPVLPCQFLDNTSLSALGTPEGEPMASSVRFDECSTKVRDAGGKELSVDVQLGAIVLFASDKTTGQVGGLPQVEVPDTTGGSCEVSALTSRDPSLGVAFEIDYPGGDPCRAGRTLLAPAVDKLHNSPQKYPEVKGSVLTADACAVLDQSAVDAVLKGTKGGATGLHSCQWGNSPNLTVMFFPAFPPLEGDGWLKADVGGANQAYAKKGTAGTDCKVEWQHRPWQGDHVEVVQVGFTDYDLKPGAGDPCATATTLAKSVAGNLPRP